MHTLEPKYQRELLDSQSGRYAEEHFFAAPTEAALRVKSERFLCLLRRRLFLTLPLAPRTCPGRTCRQTLDKRGDHLASCPRTGYLKLRSLPLERCWAQVFREAGARVVENQLLSELGLPGVVPSDRRKLEVIAYGLPLYHGVPLCVDCTLVSALNCEGVAHYNQPGRCLLEAEKEKRVAHLQAQVPQASQQPPSTSGAEV